MCVYVLVRGATSGSGKAHTFTGNTDVVCINLDTKWYIVETVLLLVSVIDTEGVARTVIVCGVHIVVSFVNLLSESNPRREISLETRIRTSLQFTLSFQLTATASSDISRLSIM